MAESLDSLLEKALAESGARSGQDALVVALHASLLSEGFVCAALGDESFGKDSTPGPALSSPSSPRLPPDWNSAHDVYTLQYRHERFRQVFLVKVIPLGEQLLINAVAAGEGETVHSTTLEVSKFIRDAAESEFKSQSVFTNLLQLVSTLNKEIVSKLTARSTKAASADSSSRRQKPDRAPLADDPLRVGPPRHPRGPIRDPDPLAEPGPFGIGDGDRLPFGAGGSSGMIFDPLRQGGRPGGGFPGSGPLGPFPPSHPPGARFDPVNPFGVPPPGRFPGRGGGGGGGRFYGEPNPDHLPPPGYDDMFS